MDTEVIQEERERLARPPQPNPEGGKPTWRTQCQLLHGSTRERKAKASRRLPNGVKRNGVIIDVGAVTTGEERPNDIFFVTSATCE